MATRQENLHAVAVAINNQVDIPFVPEYAEQLGFDWMMGKLDKFIPDRILSVAVSVSDGLSDEEIALAQEFVEHFVTSELPAVIADFDAVKDVVHRIGNAVAALLRKGYAAGAQ